MKIMVFLHGTTIMHPSGADVTREQRVRQVLDRDIAVRDYGSYIPVGGAVQKLRSWHRQGAEICYLSSHQDLAAVELDLEALRKHDFPEGDVLFRRQGEHYDQVVENALPDILIEDDCESIGGESQMAYPMVKPELKRRIKAIVVREFGGIDHLPDDIAALT